MYCSLKLEASGGDRCQFKKRSARKKRPVTRDINNVKIIIIIIIIILAKNEYLMRHDKVCTHLHYSICKALGIETTDKW